MFLERERRAEAGWGRAWFSGMVGVIVLLAISQVDLSPASAAAMVRGEMASAFWSALRVGDATFMTCVDWMEACSEKNDSPSLVPLVFKKSVNLLSIVNGVALSWAFSSNASAVAMVRGERAVANRSNWGALHKRALGYCADWIEACTSSLDTDLTRNTRAPTSPRSTGFCAIWDCISSSSVPKKTSK